MAEKEKEGILGSAERGAKEASDGGVESKLLPEMTFSSFVMSLGMQALMALGEMPAPDGAQVELNREVARQSIEILSVLVDKTKGNLSTDENRLLEEVLHNVRMAFIRG